MSAIVGNQHTIDALEEALAIARADQDIRHVACVLCARPNRVHIVRAGEAHLNETSKQGVQNLLDMTIDELTNADYPERDESLDASYACYNMVTGSHNFDFLVWLAHAEMRRRKENAPGPLKVGFWFGKDSSLIMSRPGPMMHWVEHVFRPALAFVGAVEDERATRAWHIDRYTIGMIVDAYNQLGLEIPTFKVPVHNAPLVVNADLSSREIDEMLACGHVTWVSEDQMPAPKVLSRGYEPGAITITLREADHWPHRNSNIAAWLRFAMDLRWRGENVVFIRDTSKAMEPLGDFETDPLASFDLQMRMARYQSAKANLFVSNGPVTLAVFSKVPWLQFVPVEDESSGYHANRPSFWKRANGIDVGSQYPWSTPAQRIVWERDTYHSISAAWEQIEGLCG